MPSIGREITKKNVWKEKNAPKHMPYFLSFFKGKNVFFLDSKKQKDIKKIIDQQF
jgi:hypothetical protein